ncbi:MAG TPA: hypothetical protein VFB22_05915 [Candidatus Baltobacteraceae bacterium]|nr:hypothetical protein [Candidatus Baltobacteraceae bacterium]
MDREFRRFMAKLAVHGESRRTSAIERPKKPATAGFFHRSVTFRFDAGLCSRGRTFPISHATFITKRAMRRRTNGGEAHPFAQKKGAPEYPALGVVIEERAMRR